MGASGSDRDMTGASGVVSEPPVPGQDDRGARAALARGGYPLMDFLSAEPALNRGTRLAAISIRSPVCGLTP